jgi:Kef-type K+ transport system membrane component KefB/nucleotide-binding universal stress UspA family protein
MRAGSRICLVLIAAAAPFAAPDAFAAEQRVIATGGAEALFVLQIVLLLLVGRGLGELMERVGQPAVVGQLLAGLVLGPSILGALWPAAEQAIFPPNPEQRGMIAAVSQLGILMLLLLTGMETDLTLVKRVRRAAMSVSLAGVAVPFASGFLLAYVLPAVLLPDPGKRLLTALFLGIALAISSVKIVATVVREMNFMRRNLGQIIIGSAILEDTIGWLVIAAIFSLGADGMIDPAPVALSLAGTAAFLFASLTIGRRIVFTIIREVNDNFESEFAVVTAILVIMGIMAYITDAIGVHTVLGAFVAGMLVGDSPILTQHIKDQLRGLVAALFMPVFFGAAGLSADVTILAHPAMLWAGALILLFASAGKFLGAFAGSAVAGLSRMEGLAVGCAMNARGSTEVIIASIGLSVGVLGRDLFTLIVAMAILTTMAMPPMLRWALKRIPLDAAERARIEREEIDARGFIANVERVLVAVDESPSGRFASHLAGLIAGARGIPATLLQWEAGRPGEPTARADGPDRMREVEGAFAAGAAATAGGAEHGEEGAETRKSSLVTRLLRPSQQVVAEEARKGYDLLLSGVAKSRSPDGGFSSELSNVAAGFDGTLAIAIAHANDKVPPVRGLSILLPVNGTEPSRRGAELAFLLARANEGKVTALYVSAAPVAAPGAATGLPSAVRRQERAVLKEAAELAERYDVPLRTAVRADARLDIAVLQEARQRRCDLIVMGVARRPDHGLYFGNTALAVLNGWERELLFVAT